MFISSSTRGAFSVRKDLGKFEKAGPDGSVAVTARPPPDEAVKKTWRRVASRPPPGSFSEEKC